MTRLLEGEVQKLVSMEDRLARRVIGQEPALRAVANAVRRARSGLPDPNRPIGSFLFLGPTGVGKTDLARALAEFLFDDERAMVRIDMSEYMALQILEGEFAQGDTVRVDARGDDLAFTKVVEAAPVRCVSGGLGPPPISLLGGRGEARLEVERLGREAGSRGAARSQAAVGRGPGVRR